MSTLSTFLAQNQDKLMASATTAGGSILSKLMESPKTQQALYGVADKLIGTMVPNDPREAEARVKALASAAAQAGGQAVIGQAKTEISSLQATIDQYLPYIKPLAFIIGSAIVLSAGVLTYRTFAYKK